MWKGFTLDWYPTVLANKDLVEALLVTMRVAAVAAVVSTVLQTLLGLALARRRFRGRTAAETLILVPMVTPEINAISTIIVAVTSIVILAAWRIGARRDAALAQGTDGR